MKAKKYLLFFLLGYCIYIAIEVTYRGYSFRVLPEDCPLQESECWKTPGCAAFRWRFR